MLAAAVRWRAHIERAGCLSAMDPNAWRVIGRSDELDAGGFEGHSYAIERSRVRRRHTCRSLNCHNRPANQARLNRKLLG